MDNKLQLFNFGGQNLAVKEINGEVYFNAEQAAIGLGISQVKNSKTYVQWKRVNNYLNNVSAHVRKGENSQKVGKCGCKMGSCQQIFGHRHLCRR